MFEEDAPADLLYFFIRHLTVDPPPQPLDINTHAHTQARRLTRSVASLSKLCGACETGCIPCSRRWRCQ